MPRRKLVRFTDLPPGSPIIHADPLHRKLSDRLRQRLFRAFKGGTRTGSAVRDLGCSIAELKSHLEELFLPGMSWDNYGKGPDKWCIDHIAPLSSADLTNRNQLLSVCHYTNLQPMWFEDNLRKSDEVRPRIVIDLGEFCHA